MVNPIKNQPPSSFLNPPKKKTPKEVDQRIKKALKKSKPPTSKKVEIANASQKIAAEKAYLSAEKTSLTARQRAFETKQAALKAQKAAFLAQRAHMAQQALAAKRARAAEKAKKAAQRAAKKATAVRRTGKIKAYLGRPDDKRTKLIKKYLPISKKKRKQNDDK